MPFKRKSTIWLSAASFSWQFSGSPSGCSPILSICRSYSVESTVLNQHSGGSAAPPIVWLAVIVCALSVCGERTESALSSRVLIVWSSAELRDSWRLAVRPLECWSSARLSIHHPDSAMCTFAVLEPQKSLRTLLLGLHFR